MASAAPKQKLRINDLTPVDVSRMSEDQYMFNRVIRDNKGFIEKAVFSIAKDHQHEDWDDLYQAGLFGFWNATKLYDYKKASFSTYVFKSIQNNVRQELHSLHNITRKNTDIDLYVMSTRNNGESKSHDNDERSFVDRPDIAYNRNWEECTINEMEIDAKLQTFGGYFASVFHLKYHGYKLRDIAIELGTPYVDFIKWWNNTGRKQVELLKKVIFVDGRVA